jgi:hypothetical protein
VPDGTDGEFAGVPQEQLEQNPDEYFGELFRGAHFRGISTPKYVNGGSGITVQGKVHFDAPSVVITTRGMRVRVESPALDRDYTQQFSSISHCNERSFSVRIPVPDTPGRKFPYTVYAESTKATGGWRTDTVVGPVNAEILSDTEARAATVIDYTPAVAAGAGLGYAGASVTGREDQRNALAVAGGAAGALYKRYGAPFQFNIPTPSNTQLALGSVLVLGSAYLLNSTGAADVLSATGEAAGSAIDAGRQAASQLRSGR